MKLSQHGDSPQSTAAGAALSARLSSTRFTAFHGLMALLLLNCIWLIANFHLENFNNDTAQAISTARHLIAGDGLQTSLLFYREQQLMGLPAAQTIWPPGISLAIAGLAGLGMDLPIAAYTIAIIGHLLCGLLLFALMRSLGCSHYMALATAAIWLCLFAANHSVMAADSEPLYTAIALATALLYVRALRAPDPKVMSMFAIGLLAGLAFSTRYIGLALIAAVTLPLTWAWLRSPGWSRIPQLMALSLPGTLLVALLLGRNWWLTGGLTGAPRHFQDASLVDVARHLWRGVGNTLGLQAPHWMLAVCGGLLLITLFTTAWRNRSRGNSVSASHTERDSEALRHFVPLAIIYLAAYGALLLQLALSTSAEMLVTRYFLPPFAFALVLIMLAVAHVLRARPAHYWPAAGIGLLLAFGALQLHANWQHFAQQGKGARASILATLQTPIDGQSLQHWLRTQTADGSAILATQSQFLGMLLDRPTVSLTPPIFTPTIWTEEQVIELVTQLPVSHLCLFPDYFDPESPRNLNQPFLKQLANNQPPAWLILAVEMPGVRVYRIDHNQLTIRENAKP